MAEECIYVVEFKDPPCIDFDKYVCVLGSWMVLDDKDCRRTFFKYPIEKISTTRARVKYGERFLEDYDIFEVFIKYRTNIYTKALSYINTQNKISIQEQRSGEYNEENESTTSKVKSRSKVSKSNSCIASSKRSRHNLENINVACVVASSGKSINAEKMAKSLSASILSSTSKTHRLSSRDGNSDNHHHNNVRRKGKSYAKNKGTKIDVPLTRFSLTLPPEYDENDSRWTLRYHEKTKDLVELMPNTNIYVRALRLQYCKYFSKDSAELARNLLLEIFTESALNVCTLGGKKNYNFKGNINAGLDQNALKVLFSFVKDHANKKDWGFNERRIMSNLCNKISKLRNKTMLLQ